MADASTIRVVYAPGRVHRTLEALGTIAVVVLLVCAFWRVGAAWLRTSPTLISGGALFGAVAMGLVCADFLSGLMQYTFDRFMSPTTPLLGAAFVTPFRQHHSDPVDITQHGLFPTLGNSALALVPLLIAAKVGIPLHSLPAQLAMATLTSTMMFLFLTNQFHQWAHRVDVPASVAWLQARGLMLSQQHHLQHHSFPYESYYCITVGWLNRPLVAIGFWKTCDFLLAKVCGFHRHEEPHAWEHDRSSTAYGERAAMVAAGFAAAAASSDNHKA
jgi:plasmanylethanolamine desaturase